MRDSASLLQFPCSYPLKVMGRNTKEFLAVVSAVIEKHVGRDQEIMYSTRLSSKEKYMSVTATFSAQSHGQLTAIYGELNAHELVLITL